MRLTASGHASGAGSLRAGSVITLDLGSLAFGADGEMLAPNIDLNCRRRWRGAPARSRRRELFIGEIGGAFDQGGALRAAWRRRARWFCVKIRRPISASRSAVR